MEILTGNLPNEPFLISLLAGVITYIVQVVFRSPKAKARIIGNALSFIIVFLVRILRNYHKSHPETFGEKVDKVYSHVFHLKDDPKQDKIIVG